MVDHVAGKPRIGAVVHYFNPKIITRVGWTLGYGGRAAGPYVAIVTNNLGDGLSLYILFPGIIPVSLDAVVYEDAVTDKTEKGYWTWAQPIDAARAAKEAKPD
jgi:hypothetical protein